MAREAEEAAVATAGAEAAAMSEAVARGVAMDVGGGGCRDSKS